MAATPSEAAERDARHPSPIIKQDSLTQCPDAHWGINAAASTAAAMPPTFQRTLGRYLLGTSARAQLPELTLKQNP